MIAIAAAGVVAGVIGILIGVAASRRASRAVHECRDLVQGAVGSHGTVDPRALRDVAIVRYDALREMSGQLSFSLALLNAMGDGVVLSSINGRAETRTYAKPVVAGQGEAGTVARGGAGRAVRPAGDRAVISRGDDPPYPPAARPMARGAECIGRAGVGATLTPADASRRAAATA